MTHQPLPSPGPFRQLRPGLFRVLRLEHTAVRGAGGALVGPYRQSTGFSALDENAKRLARRHEGVQRPAWAQMRWFWHDGTPAELPTEEYLSGFLQLADVLAWFSPSDLAELDELGFVLKEYEVSALDVLAAPADDERLAQAAFLVDMTRVLRVHRPLDALL